MLMKSTRTKQYETFHSGFQAVHAVNRSGSCAGDICAMDCDMSRFKLPTWIVIIFTALFVFLFSWGMESRNVLCILIGVSGFVFFIAELVKRVMLYFRNKNR